MVPSMFLFSFTLVLGAVVSLTASSWVLIWAGLEMNLVSFIALCQGSPAKGQTSAPVTKYFISQAVGSLLFLAGALGLPPVSGFSSYFVLAGLLTKLGAAPLHFWLVPVASSLGWGPFILMMTWQKVAPTFLLFLAVDWVSLIGLTMVGVSGSLVGGVGAVGQTQLRAILAFSAISHTAWMIPFAAFNKPAAMAYFTAYTLLLLPVLFCMRQVNSLVLFSMKAGSSPSVGALLSLLMLSLSGIPPFSGFFLKWAALQQLMVYLPMWAVLFMALSSIVGMYYYLSIFFAGVIMYTVSAPRRSYWKVSSPILSSFVLSWSFFFLVSTAASGTLCLV